MPLTDHGVHFIAQPYVEGEVVADVPVSLDIYSDESRPVAPRANLDGKPSLEGPGVVEEEALDGRSTRGIRIRQGGETQQSGGEIQGKGIVTHILAGKAEFQRMGSTSQKCVVVELVGIPTEKGKSAGQTPSGPREARHDHAGRIISRHHAEGRVPEGELKGPRQQVVSRE